MASSSESELHQTRVQDQRQEEVEGDPKRQWPYRGETLDLPVVWHESAHRTDARQDNHSRRHQKAVNESEFELLDDGRDFIEERRSRCFL